MAAAAAQIAVTEAPRAAARANDFILGLSHFDRWTRPGRVWSGGPDLREPYASRGGGGRGGATCPEGRGACVIRHAWGSSDREAARFAHPGM